jgi:hypothetical protein
LICCRARTPYVSRSTPSIPPSPRASSTWPLEAHSCQIDPLCILVGVGEITNLKSECEFEAQKHETTESRSVPESSSRALASAKRSHDRSNTCRVLAIFRPRTHRRTSPADRGSRSAISSRLLRSTSQAVSLLNATQRRNHIHQTDTRNPTRHAAVSRSRTQQPSRASGPSAADPERFRHHRHHSSFVHMHMVQSTVHNETECKLITRVHTTRRYAAHRRTHTCGRATAHCQCDFPMRLIAPSCAQHPTRTRNDARITTQHVVQHRPWAIAYARRLHAFPSWPL